MFKNYVLTALRNLKKNKLFALINVGGLAIGLAVFVFANLLATYEESHDRFFENYDRIYAIKTDVNPAARLGIVSIDTVYTAVGPLIKQEIPEIERVARSASSSVIINRDELKFYQSAHMVDPEFLDIFKFDYLHGDPNQKLTDTNSVIITETTAIKYFGRIDVLDEKLTINNTRDLRITGVIRDLPLNSHLAQNLLTEESLAMILNIEVYNEIFHQETFDNWSNISIQLKTYVLLPENVSPESLEERLDAIIDRFGPEDSREQVDSIGFRSLPEMNLLIWHAIGIPGIPIMRFLGLLVLGIACINFINLATAQALGRAREIGLRKTLGASRGRLAVQFLVEAVVIAFLGLIVAIGLIEYALPVFNSATNKIMTFSYLTDFSLLGFMVLTVLMVGILSGSFPALLLARLEASQALKGTMALGKWSLRFRKSLVISQNAFSVFLVITVMISFSQIQALQNRELGFDASNVQVLNRINREGVNENYVTLKNELARTPGVKSVTAASQYPYEQSTAQGKFNTVMDRASAVSLGRISVDYNFLETFNIPLLAGRQLSEDFAADAIPFDVEIQEAGTINVIISELAVNALGWENPEQALGQTIYRMLEDEQHVSFVVVGVSADALFQGFFNEQKPYIYIVRPENFGAALIKYDPAMQSEAVTGIEAVWKRVLPDFPVLRSSLDEEFAEVFSIFTNINKALVGFAVVALIIATVGLFGLSAFMADRRIREVGVRKTFGASTWQIVKLLTLQFSKPVFWAILIAWVLAWVVNFFTQDFFAEVMSMDFSFYMIFIYGGMFSLVLSWITVGSNAYRAANTNPINSLHYE
jgi:putative ABC transport system permease protein